MTDDDRVEPKTYVDAERLLQDLVDRREQDEQEIPKTR
jgi:hypothetical protein